MPRRSGLKAFPFRQNFRAPPRPRVFGPESCLFPRPCRLIRLVRTLVTRCSNALPLSRTVSILRIAPAPSVPNPPSVPYPLCFPSPLDREDIVFLFFRSYLVTLRQRSLLPPSLKRQAGPHFLLIFPLGSYEEILLLPSLRTGIL